MGRRRGPTLAERTAGLASRDAPAHATADGSDGDAPDGDGDGRVRPVATRHCWVTGLPERPGRWAGLLAEWRLSAGGWQGRVVYAVDDGGATVLLEAWLPARHLQPVPASR